MLSPKHEKFLRDLFPGDGSLFTPEENLIFGIDASRLSGTAWAVVRPEAREQVVELLRWAEYEKIPLFTRGRATNVVGAAVPGDGSGQGMGKDAGLGGESDAGQGGVVVSMLRMNRIKEISADDFVAVVEPGVINGDFQQELKRRGLFYPPDPASASISTLGGNVAMGAGGMRAVKYGVTRDYVLGVEAVLPGGKIMRLGGRCHKNVAGLDLARLFVGSEGTLGVMTELTLKLLPLPEATASLLAGFATVEKAMDAERAVFGCGTLPAAMEFMAGLVLDAISQVGEGGTPWSRDTQAVLLLRIDGSEPAVAEDLRRLEAVFRRHDPACLLTGRGADEDRLWELRKLINPASFRIAPDKISDDVTVPRGKLGEAVRRFEALGKDRGLKMLLFGHLGDGNLHVNIMHDAANQDERARALAAKEEVMRITLELGGTLSGEHGIGLTKLPYLHWQIGENERALMREVKKAFDPSGILNPGKGY